MGVKINNNKVINCDFVICNSDPPGVYKNLITEKKNYGTLFKQKMKRMDYSMGLFVYYFGSKKQYKNVAHHTIFFGKSYKDHLSNIFEKKNIIRRHKLLFAQTICYRFKYGPKRS